MREKIIKVNIRRFLLHITNSNAFISTIGLVLLLDELILNWPIKAVARRWKFTKQKSISLPLFVIIDYLGLKNICFNIYIYFFKSSQK